MILEWFSTILEPFWNDSQAILKPFWNDAWWLANYPDKILKQFLVILKPLWTDSLAILANFQMISQAILE